MFHSEVRFYREIAPVVGVRVPECFEASYGDDGSRLVLEDLSEWRPGADPMVAAELLSGMHRRWAGQALGRWPWLRRVGAAADLVGDLYDRTWPEIAARTDLTPAVRAVGERLLGRVADAERTAVPGAPLTLIHGDASARNLRTDADGVVAFLDWEDVSAAPGVTDLAWLLLSSVPPERWDEVISAYGPVSGMAHVLPGMIAQALFSLGDAADGSADAAGWLSRIESAASRLS